MLLKNNYKMPQALIHLIQLLKKDFIVLKAEVGKLDIDEVANLPTSLNSLKTKVDDLDVRKLKTVTVDLKQMW